MSNIDCLANEDVVYASSSLAGTETVIVGSSAGTGSSSADASAQNTVVELATGSSTTEIEHYALLVSGGAATDDSSGGMVLGVLVTSAGAARDSASTVVLDTCTDAGTATSFTSGDVDTVVDSLAAGTSELSASRVMTLELHEAGTATGTATVASGVSWTDTVQATSNATPTMVSGVELTGSATGSSTLDSSVAQGIVLDDVSLGTSGVVLNTTTGDRLDDLVLGASSVVIKDVGRVAYIMNTESTAGSTYSNYNFESVVQVGDKVLGVGPDGLYEMVGGNDDGETINASVTTGLMDFGVRETKRLEYVYLGYTSDGRISVTLETYGSGHAPATYLLEQRPASAPRNSRVEPGKGLVGRYWRMTLRNHEGKDFEIYDMAADVAVSPRRV